MKQQKFHKVRFSERLLTWCCKDQYLEEILGDLAEYRDELAAQRTWKRRVLYWFHVVNFLKPWALKNLGGSQKLNQYGMFKNYFKTSFRSLRKNALFSTINVVGLAISMSVGVLMILFLSELSSFDDFHDKQDRIYRVTSSQIQGRGVMVKNAYGSPYIASQLQSQVSGVDQVLVMSNSPLTVDLKTEERAVPISGYFAGATFFDVFSFNLIQGNPLTALAAPNGIVLTETAAKRLFGDTDPMGQLVTAINDTYQQGGRVLPPDLEQGIVTGIVEDPPLNSHLRFEMLVSLKTLDKRAITEERNVQSDPGYVSSNYVYVVLNEEAEQEVIEEAMSGFLTDFNAEREDNPLSHTLQPMSDFITSDTYHGGGPSFSQSRVNIMIGLTLIVLLSAGFNYTNLSLARALRRSKEIGIRKVAGATRFQVFSQFMVEAVMLSVLALLIGVGLFYLIRPEFLKLPNPSAPGFEMFMLNVSAVHLLYFFLFAISVGLMAGFLPALFHSKLKASLLFRDAGGLRLFKGVNLRKVLIVFQFALSIGLIMCAVLVDNQYKFTLNYDLGYSTENILTIDVKGDYIQQLENEYASMPEVQEMSKSSWVLGVGGDGLTVGMIFSEDRSSRSLALLNHIDENYLAMHDLDLLAGAGFTTALAEGQDATQIIVNEAFLDAFALGSPQEALGKKVLYNGSFVSILGVVEEPVSIGLTKKFIDSFVFIQTNRTDQYKSLNLKVQTNDLVATMGKLEEAYAVQDPVHPFNAAFYEDRLTDNYKSAKGTYTIISFLAFLAISISTLGLLGMAVFTTESRMKEISIRKVLGAGIKQLMVLLSRSFMFLMVIAAVVAIPTTLYIVENEVLNGFWERAEIGIGHMLSGFFIVLVIGVITIGWQVGKAARSNPATLLRNE